MKNIFPVKLIIPSRFTPPTYNWLSINNEKFYKESFFSFKDKEHLLKDTDSFFVQEQKQAIHSPKPDFH